MRIKNALVYTVEHGFEERDVRIKNGCFAGGEAETPARTGKRFWTQGELPDSGACGYPFSYGCAGHDFSGRNTGGITAGDRRVRASPGCDKHLPCIDDTLSEETLKTVCANAYAYTKRPEAEQDTGATDRDSSGRTVYFHGEKGCAESGLYPESGCRDVPAAAGGSTRASAPDYDCTGDGRCQKEFIRRLADQKGISRSDIPAVITRPHTAHFRWGGSCDHFFNAMPPFTHRAPGVFGAAFDAKHVMPELICDGIHIDASAVRVVFSCSGRSA